MKKLVYLLIGDYTKYAGVLKKVNNEIKAFEKAGMECKLINIKERNSNIKALVPFSSAVDYSAFNLPDGIDILYIRYAALCFPLIRLMKQAKRKKIKVIMEIAAYPDCRAELKKGSNFIVYYRDVLYSKLLRYLLKRIVITTDYEMAYNVPTIKINNMVDLNALPTIKSTEFGAGNVINILAVAIVASWHGYDRMIEGLYHYYRTAGEKKNIIFHIVGDGFALPSLKEMVYKYGLENHVRFYGIVNGEKLDEIYEIADIGIDVLGTHRKGDYAFGSLKSMEYLGKGLPFITEYPIPESVNEVKKYILKVPADESPVDIESVISFYMKLKEEQKQDIVSNMRKFAYSYCDISVAMKPVIDYLLEE